MLKIGWAALGPLLALELVLLVWALLDLWRRPKAQVAGPKWIWLLVIVLLSTLGPLAYLLLGRRSA